MTNLCICRVFLRIERSPMRQQELSADSRQTLPPTNDVTDDRDDSDTVSTLLRDEHAYDFVDDISECADSRSTVDVESVGLEVDGAGGVDTVTVSRSGLSDVSSSCATSEPSRSSPSKSVVNSTPASVAGLQQISVTESTSVSENVSSAGMQQLPTASVCSVVFPPSKLSDSSSSLSVVKSTTVSSRTEPVQTTQTARGRISTASTRKMAAAVQPLAKKGLTHLLNSSTALFHRRRHLRSDSETKSLSVGYSGSTVSMSTGQSESPTPSELSISLSEAGSESLSQNIEPNVVPVVCDNVTFMMVKDDFCQKPSDLSSAEKTEDFLTSSLSCDDSSLTSKTSLSPSSEVVAGNDKTTADTLSVGSHQVLCLCSYYYHINVKKTAV